MPSKKKKYNARFPPARIKKIMQSDEEVGKVAQVVPIIISKSLEIFVEQLLSASAEVTRSRNARTLTPTHIKTSILQKPEFAFLSEIAQTIPDVNTAQEDGTDTDPGDNSGPVDFSIRSTTTTTTTAAGQQSSPVPARLPTATTRAPPAIVASATTTPSVINLSNSSISLPAVAPGPRPRGRPRKRPLPEEKVAASVASTSFPLNTKKMVSSYGIFTPTLTMPSSMAPFGNPGGAGGSLPGVPPPSSVLPTTSSSLEALTSVIAMQAKGHGHRHSQPPSQQQQQSPYPRTITTTTASLRSKSSLRPNSESESAYDNGHNGGEDEDEEEEDDGDEDDDDEDTETDDDDEEYEEVGSQRPPPTAPVAATSVVVQPSAAGHNNKPPTAQRPSVLVPNPISMLSLGPPPVSSTITSKGEDDDYDNL